MAYDSRGHTPTLQIMLNNHGISKKTYLFYRKRYPNLSLRDLLIQYIIERDSHDL